MSKGRFVEGARKRFLAFLLPVVVAVPAGATIWSVPGDGSNTCTSGSPNCDTIAAAITAASGGDTIQIAAGSFVESGLAVSKTLTIEGAGASDTLVQPPAATTAFTIAADNVVLRDLSIQGGAIGATMSAASTNTEFRRVHFTGNTSRGINISAITANPINDVRIIDCRFATAGATGLRMASTSRVSGLTITGTTFSGNQFGIYQANDGNTSRLSGMEISGSTFTGNTSYAIYVEELRDSTIENSTFTSNGVAFLLLKIYSTSGVAASDITIQGNTFSGHTGTVLDIEVRSSGLEGTLSVVDNTITQNVGVHTSTGRSAIFLWLRSTFVHGPTYVTDNTIHLTGTFATSTSAHGIRVRGNGPVYLSGNELDGGNVGGSGTTPPTTGLYIEVASTDPMTADAVVDASCNTITGFRNGVSMFNSTAADYGDLPAGATVTLGVNDISGNSDAGVRNGGSSTALDAIGSWWGCTAGPGNPGCDSVVGAVLVAPHLTVPPSCSPSGPCPSAPVTGCQDGATGKGLLAMSIKPGDPAKSKLGWKWGKGAATTKAEFGAPKTTTDYRLCVYDGDGVRQLSLRAPAGGTCAGKDCWKETRKGFKYKDKEATPDGIVALALTEGVAGKAKIGLVAKGALLTLPSLPLAQSSPVRVQLLNSGTSSCWQASYTLPAGTKPGITSKWKDKND